MPEASLRFPSQTPKKFIVTEPSLGLDTPWFFQNFRVHQVLAATEFPNHQTIHTLNLAKTHAPPKIITGIHSEITNKKTICGKACPC